MRIRLYEDLDTNRIQGYSKFRQAIEAGDLARADVRKIDKNLYRAKLNRSDRLLFSFYSHAGQTDCLVLEHLPNHAYEKSRFLNRGVTVDENRIGPIVTLESIDAEPLSYLHPTSERFHILDKVLSFDDDQQAIHDLPPPLIIVGSAGSGKTALTLTRLKQTVGEVLYVSLSPYLVENARSLYYANGYRNDDQELDFLSFREFLESLKVPEGREVTFADFDSWFNRHRQGSGLRDAHTLFEEFRGVITASAGTDGPLTREQYLALGIRQSIFTDAERHKAYDLFERYKRFLDENALYDPNLMCHRYRDLAQAHYDFVVVDEVQDVTNIQLYLVLKTLKQAGDFLLCGDANQIVHPNFFSWSSLKSLFFDDRELAGRHDTLHVLTANYRNSPLVSNVANRILKLKHARFGSVDRESNHLVVSRGSDDGTLQLLEDGDKVRAELDTRTRRSARFAVLVMHADDKAEAHRVFDTPLVFSIQEAKGLEYDSIILFNFIAGEEKTFRDIAAGVEAAALETDTLDYARAKRKDDKSLEIFKFYINALYVATTRAVKNLYIVEKRIHHPALQLLDLARYTGELSLEKQDSSLEDWQREARRLELQGKREQAEAIHERILKRKPVPWQVLDRERVQEARIKAFESGHKKQLLLIFEEAVLTHHRATLSALEAQQYKPARQDEQKALKQLYRNHYMSYELSSINTVLKDTERYGIDHRTVFNLTPLMVATRVGNEALVEALLERGADRRKLATHGLDAAQMALEMCITKSLYAHKAVRIYPLLAPESLSIQVDGRLVKVGGHLMSLFLFNLMFAMFYRHLGNNAGLGDGFSAAVIADWVSDLPDTVLPARRRKQSYISSVLSGNEVDRDDPYNRKLFKRLRRGHYIPNPNLAIRLNGEWQAVYERLQLDDLAASYQLETTIPIHSEAQRQLRERLRDDLQWRRNEGLKRFRRQVRAMIMQQSESPTAGEESAWQSIDTP